MPVLPIRGLIFDLDGTLVDSGLDFDLIRREMGLPQGQPLLEALATLDDRRAADCRAVLARHEWAGAERASLMPGVRDFLASIESLQIRTAILTRNARGIALATLERLKVPIATVLGREDAPVKPDPAAIWKICELWGLPREQVAMVGDYLFDIQAGRSAGVKTVFYRGDRSAESTPWAGQADFALDCFSEPAEFLAWLAEPT